jgi:death-on-curing protein
VDGNNRVGALAAVLFLLINGQRLDAAPKELEEMTWTLARGELDGEALAIWFRQRISRED